MSELRYVIDICGLEEGIRCAICENPMHTDKGCDGNCKYNEKAFKRITDLLDKRIELLPIAPEPHWIPVTKDLPKESGHYIVTTRTVCLPINLLHPELDRYSNNVRIDYFRAYDNKFDLPSTVAWWSEPLPEPYEGVTE